MTSTRFLGATALISTLALLPAAAQAQAGTQPAQSSPAAQAARNPQNAQGPSPADQSAGTGSPLVNGSQTPQADEGNQGGTSGEVLVTGTRISRPNLDSSVPITAITAADLTDTGNVSLGDELNKLPALRATYSQANSTRNIGTAGLNLLDLRGLGTDRTLVLVNGRRHVSAVPGSYNVDVNTIPNALLDSVDVVTGGTSAVYGSDAIAGVVNFKLKTDFQGIEARFQGGVSSRKDRGSYIASIVAGQNFADDRGNIAASAEYAHSESVLFSDRNDQTGAFTGTPGFGVTQKTQAQLVAGGPVVQLEGPGGDGIADRSYFGVYPGFTFGGTQISLAGTVVTSCPTATGVALNTARRSAVCSGIINPTNIAAEYAYGYYFSNDGQLLQRDNPAADYRGVGGGVLGGRAATGVEGAMLLPGLDRFNGNILFNYEFSPAVRVFAEGKFVHERNNQTSTQPTFINSSLSPTFFLDNPFLTPAEVAIIQTVQGYPTTNTTGTFNFFRFNNDIGTRAENHVRDTYRAVFGVRGDISDAGRVKYEISGEYGRTNTYYKTGGNVDLAKFNRAENAALAPAGFAGSNYVLNAAGQKVVCRANAGVAGNAFPDCYPLDLFGINNEDPRAVNYVLYTSQRRQWATELDLVGSVAGDTSMLFSLPAGGIGFAFGGEYRKEDAFSDYDDFTQGGNTFLNSIAQFDPPHVSVTEGFGEVRVPILKDMFFNELTLEGAARYSKYSTANKGVWAYNYGAVFAPIRDLRFRVGYARSVRAPNLSDLFATASQTFANNFVDPCNQGTIQQAVNPTVRAANCLAAGIPTTFTYTDSTGPHTIPWVNQTSSGIAGVNSGNANLRPEIGTSFTLGGIFEPRFLKGFALSVDYYNIKVRDVIQGLSGQTIINQCYDDPGGINNQYCALISRRTSADPIVNLTFAGQSNRTVNNVAIGTFTTTPGVGVSFVNAPLNYALLKTAGIDADLTYNHLFPNGVRVSYRGLLSWLQKRWQYTSVSVPTQATRINGTLGDPTWKGQFSANLSYKGIDFGYDLNYLGRQAVDAWELQHTFQGRGPTNLDAYPISEYAPQMTHDFQLGFRVNKSYRAYIGVDNAFDALPPYGLTGTGAGSGIYSVVGRFMYAGVNLKY